METTQQKELSKKQRVAGLTAIIVLLVVSGAAIYFVNKQNTENKTITAQKAQLEQEYKSLNASLDQKTAELEEFRGKNAELDKAINEKQADIDKQKERIESLLKKGSFTESELKKTKGLIAQYETSITDLKAQVDRLVMENQQLASMNAQLGNELTFERNVTAEQQQKIAGLSKKVEIGSLLHLENMQVEAIKEKPNGKERSVKRVKAADGIKISFETGENKVLDPGTLNLYVRVINPKGETISVANQGSGTIASKDKAGEVVPYSRAADIDYDQNNKKVAVYWNQHIDQPGTYQVEVYQDGHLIGRDDLALN
jgi:myosin heavy subunit